MIEVTRYECEHCGDLFRTSQECEEHEYRHIAIEKANELLEQGETLQEINDITGIWKYGVPDHLKDVNKENCFTISYWQCCSKPAYRITRIYFDGRVKVWGCGSWNGYYGNDLELNNSNLKNPRPKEELFIDSRYEGSRW